MNIQLINRTDPERILVNVLNGEASSLTTGFGVALAIGNEDVVASANGVTAVLFTNSAELRPGFIGVAKADIAPNTYGPVIAWGFADSIALSQEANVTVGLLAGASLLRAGAQAGCFTSALAAQAISTYCGKYVVNATTQSCTGGINYTRGLIRAI